MKKLIYQTWNLYSLEEQAELIKNYNEDRDEPYSEEEVAELVNNEYEDNFGDHGNLVYSKIKDIPVVITGTLGLWDGTHEIFPDEHNNLQSAINKCCGGDADEFCFYEDENGDFNIDAHHHDGTNHFIIHRYVNNTQSPINFISEIFG